MSEKDSYLDALLKGKGRFNAIDIGAQIGLDENDTRSVISQLLAEYKIEFLENGHCEYSIMKTQRKKRR